MAKRELKGSGGALTPTVKLSQKDGSKFIGVLEGSKPGTYGKIFQFKVEDTDAPITLKEGEHIKEVDVKVGDLVAVFGSGQLGEKLSQAKIGEKIEIVFKGKKLNPNTGRYFNDYSANVIE